MQVSRDERIERVTRQAELHQLASALVAAHKDGAIRVPSERFEGLSLAEAAAIQQLVVSGLGDPIMAAKVGLAGDGVALAAPIGCRVFCRSGEQLAVPKRGILGLEVEIAARLRADIAPGQSTDVENAIAGFLVTIEFIGSRLTNHTSAGPWGSFADNMITAGLVAGTQALPRSASHPDGLRVSVRIDGDLVLDDIARHPFGDVLAPIRRFSENGVSGLSALSTGMIVTTGSLTELVPVDKACEVEVRLGDFLPLAVHVLSSE